MVFALVAKHLSFVQALRKNILWATGKGVSRLCKCETWRGQKISVQRVKKKTLNNINDTRLYEI